VSNIFENKDRRVIPNFRSLAKTAELGELENPKITRQIFHKKDLADYISDFENSGNLAVAGDLISAAFVNNITDDKKIIEAAEFILDETRATGTQKKIATKLLKRNRAPELNTTISKLDEFLSVNDGLRLRVRQRVSELRASISQFPFNPFAYAELARIFSIIGRQEDATKNILIARNLAPSNRYILRAYSRLLAHYDDIEQAHDVLKKNPVTKLDPWLMASEIAFSSLRNKSSNFIKKGLELIDSKQYSPFSISELASSIGTVELLNGSRKKSTSLFRTALIAPNDNALAQVEWADNKDHLFDLDITRFQAKNNAEAFTLNSYDNQDWKATIENAEKWFLDTPFASRPIMFGSHAASFFLNDQETAVKFCKAGLIANPNDPQIINNIAYAYALANDVSNAKHYLDKINVEQTVGAHKICLLATKGLVHYREGNAELGRALYLQAIEQALEEKNQYYYDLALMHLTREEIAVNSEHSNELVEKTSKINAKNSLELSTMKIRVVEANKKRAAAQKSR